MEWQPKPWGRFREIFRDDKIQIVEAEIEAGGYSSIHWHRGKDNAFLVVEGLLAVAIWPAWAAGGEVGNYPPESVLLLRAHGGAGTVFSMQPHRFCAPQKTRLLEVYRAAEGETINPGGFDDIRRYDDGGIFDKQPEWIPSE